MKFIEIKGIVILVKVDEMYNIVKCLLATGRDMKVELDDQGFAGAEIWLVAYDLKPFKFQKVPISCEIVI